MSRFALTLGLVGASLAVLAETVVESAREIPLIEDVDVVVVGGGFSAVSAAIAAKEAGASVFVVTPRQNPGEDMIATRRLWVSADDENLDDPLVSDLFPIQRQALFSYVPSVKAVSPHQDDQHTVLKDGTWNDATNNSAQYGDKNNPCSSVTFTVTPDPGAYHITAVRLYAYSGTSSEYGGFGTGGLSVADQAERPFFVPPESIVSANGTVATWTSAADVPLTAFCPEGVENVFVAGMMADVDRSIAERLAYPGVGCVIGRRLGAAAAVAAAVPRCVSPAVSLIPVPRCVSPAALPRTGTDVSDVEVRESLNRPIGIGSIAAGTVPSRGAALPILAEVDVVVVGGGTAGGPAAIAAASEGKRVLVAEWLHVMGGTTTEGRIATYYHGNDRGFSKLQVDAGTRGNNAIGWVFSETKSEWFRRTAVAAVAETMFLPKEEFSMQGSAASPHVPGRSYYNTDVGFLNNSDAVDLFSFALRARRGISTEKHWNLSHVHVGARERRRIVGDWIVTPEDELIGKTYADTIMHGKSDYDMHGFSTGALMMFHNRPHGQDYSADLPYRALLPRTLEGVLVTGLAISADRDAMPLIRMQRDVQNQGYAAGLAAAMACDAGGVRAIDIRALQQKLVDAKCLDARVLTETDSGYDAAKAEAAIAALDENFFGLPWILAYLTETKDLVRAAYLAAEAGSEHQKALALALLLIGDETGLDTVIAAFAAADVTQGKNFQGLGNYGRQTSEFDYCLYALSKSASPKAAAAVARRIDEFVNEAAKAIRPYSHFRMAALLSEKLPSERIAARLATLPSRHETFKSYVKSGTPEAVSYSSDNVMDSERLQTMRELSLARTQYRFGDAKAEASLRKYLGDYRTIYATYAAEVLGLEIFPRTPGAWTDAETYTVDLGSPAAPATLSGTVALDFDLGQNVTLDFRGTFDIRVGTINVGGQRQGELTSGDGHLRAKCGGTVILIR